MANLVVDSGVAIKWFVPEPYSVQARQLLNDYQSGSLSFIAAELINAEVGNIVWKKQLCTKSLVEGRKKPRFYLLATLTKTFCAKPEEAYIPRARRKRRANRNR